MTDETHHKVSEDNPRRLQKIVIGLAVIYVMTFLSGFLQDTQFNFVNYIFFSLLFIGGIVLIRVTVKSEATGMTKGILFSRVPGSGVIRGRGAGERETTASSLAGKEESSRKEDKGGQGKDGPAGAIAQGGNGR